MKLKVPALIASAIILGLVIPRLVIPDGTKRYSGAEERAAKLALAYAALGCLDNPIAALLSTRLRVISLKMSEPIVFTGATHASGAALSSPAHQAEPNFEALIRAHGPFGIPAGIIATTARSTSCRPFEG